MAQQEVDRLWAELQRVEELIQDQQAKIVAATKAKELPELIALDKERRDQLFEEKKDLRHQLSALQIRLANPSGEILMLQPDVDWCNDSRPTTARCQLQTAWHDFGTQVVPSCAAHLCLQQSLVQLPRALMQLVLGFCWVAAGSGST